MAETAIHSPNSSSLLPGNIADYISEHLLHLNLPGQGEKEGGDRHFSWPGITWKASLCIPSRPLCFICWLNWNGSKDLEEHGETRWEEPRSPSLPLEESGPRNTADQKQPCWTAMWTRNKCCYIKPLKFGAVCYSNLHTLTKYTTLKKVSSECSITYILHSKNEQMTFKTNKTFINSNAYKGYWNH